MARSYNVISDFNRMGYEEATAFARQLQKFKDSIAPGMTFTVYLETEDQKIDTKPRKARVIEKHPNWLLLKDDRGFRYGPTYHKLLSWGNT